MENNNSNPEYDIHPLDRDYSEPVPKPPKRRLTGDGALVRIGAAGFGLGFLVLLVAAIAVGNGAPGGILETVGSYLHQFGMLIILGAGLSVIIAYRAPKVRQMVRSGKFTAPSMRMTLPRLFWINAIVFVGIIGLSVALTNAPSSYFVYLALTSMLTLSAAWMVIMIVWHDGILKAFAIGVLSGLIFNGVFGVLAGSGQFWGVRGAMTLATHLGLIQLSGLLCAVYVGLLEESRRTDETQPDQYDKIVRDTFKSPHRNDANSPLNHPSSESEN